MSRRKSVRDMGEEPRITAGFLDPLAKLSSVLPSSGLAGDSGRNGSEGAGNAVLFDDGGSSNSASSRMQDLAGDKMTQRIDIAEKIKETEVQENPNWEEPSAVSKRTLYFEFFDAKLPEIDSQVAFSAYYLGANLLASAGEFNQRLRNMSESARGMCYLKSDHNMNHAFFSLDRFIELGIMVGNLGALTLLPIPREMRDAKERDCLIRPEFLLMGGLGEPGTLTRDDVRFVMTNVVCAMKALRKCELSTQLVGVASRSLNVRQSLRAIIEGVKDGMERFDMPEMKLKVVYESDEFPYSESQIRSTIQYVSATFEGEIRIEANLARGTSRFTESDAKRRQSCLESGMFAGAEDEETAFTRLTVTADTADEMLRAIMSDGNSAAVPKRWKDLKYSALTSNSVIPTRTVQIQNAFAELLPNTVLDVRTFMDQWEYGNLMMHCFVPDDFQKIIEEGEKLTLVVDRDTARIPWEMAGFSSKHAHKFFGTDLEISRQFRSVLGCTNAHPPELNSRLKILIIADPVSDKEYALEGAAEEAAALTRIFAQAQKAYEGKLEIKIHLRSGNEFRQGGSIAWRQIAKEQFRALKQLFPGANHIDTDFCRPIEILKLLVHEKFDIVHFAGHGRFVPETGEMGWMLDTDCTLTAKEIFRVRQVPRLVFANACRSGEVRRDTPEPTSVQDNKNYPKPQDAKAEQHANQDEILENLYRDIALYRDDMRKKVLFGHMSMAEAFFARGIPNFLGTGWNVDDSLALELASNFYRHLLGIDAEGRLIEEGGKAIGEALRLARKSIGPDKSRLEAEFRAHKDHDDIFDHPRDRLDHEHNIHNTWGAYQHYGIPTERLFVPRVSREGN